MLRFGRHFPSWAPLNLTRLAARAALLSLLPAWLAAQSPTSGAITGRVVAATDSGAGAPLVGARVLVLGGPISVTRATAVRAEVGTHEA
jgi:hypothetical protein